MVRDVLFISRLILLFFYELITDFNILNVFSYFLIAYFIFELFYQMGRYKFTKRIIVSVQTELVGTIVFGLALLFSALGYF